MHARITRTHYIYALYITELECTLNVLPRQSFRSPGTGIRGPMRGMATLSQGNQELLVVRDKVA